MNRCGNTIVTKRGGEILASCTKGADHDQDVEKPLRKCSATITVLRAWHDVRADGLALDVRIEWPTVTVKIEEPSRRRRP